MYIKNPKSLLSTAASIILIGIVAILVLSKQQDAKFAEEHTIYQNAQFAYETGNYEEAMMLLQTIFDGKEKNEKLNLLASSITYAAEEYDKAAQYTQKVLDLNPYKVENAEFMLRLGVSYFHSGSYDKARVALLHCQAANFNPESMPNYQQVVASYLAQLPNE